MAKASIRLSLLTEEEPIFIFGGTYKSFKVALAEFKRFEKMPFKKLEGFIEGAFAIDLHDEVGDLIETITIERNTAQWMYTDLFRYGVESSFEKLILKRTRDKGID